MNKDVTRRNKLAYIRNSQIYIKPRKEMFKTKKLLSYGARAEKVQQR